MGGGMWLLSNGLFPVGVGFPHRVPRATLGQAVQLVGEVPHSPLLELMSRQVHCHSLKVVQCIGIPGPGCVERKGQVHSQSS